MKRLPIYLFSLCMVMAGAGSGLAQPVKLGAGTYLASPKTGDRAVPKAEFRTEAMLSRAAPSAQDRKSTRLNSSH